MSVTTTIKNLTLKSRLHRVSSTELRKKTLHEQDERDVHAERGRTANPAGNTMGLCKATPQAAHFCDV